VPYPCFFIYGICHAHILDISLCPHIHFCIEYNHSNMRGMICTKHPTFSTCYLPLHNYRARHYHLEVPYL
jgi:hypothetical protein